MKKVIVSLLAVSALTAAALPASAAPWMGGHRNLAERIEQGERSGALNHREAQRLWAELRDLDRTEARYRMSGGGIDRREAFDLRQREERLSAEIRYQKHDDDRRGGGRRF